MYSNEEPALQIAVGNYILALIPTDTPQELPQTSLAQAQCLHAAATALVKSLTSLAERDRIVDWDSPEAQAFQEQANEAEEQIDQHLAALCQAPYDDSSDMPC